MIDFHSHFLPDIDDGAKSVCESVEILSSSYSQGITLCVATPHVTVHKNDEIDTFLSKRAESVKELEAELSKNERRIPKLRYGAEVMLDNDISEFKDIKKLCIEDTNIMVVELPVLTYLPSYSDWIYSLSVKGIHLILAHVERYHYFKHLHDEIEDLNITYQVNAESLLYLHGRHFTKKLYNSEKNVIISSDVHGMTHRKNYMLDAHNKIAKRSKTMADDLFERNAYHLLINNPIIKHNGM